MLILSRRPTEVINVGDDIEVHVLSIQGQQVRIGIHAPPDVKVLRREIAHRQPNAKPEDFEAGTV